MRTVFTAAAALVLLGTAIGFAADTPEETPSPQQIEATVLGHLSAGRQSEAEELLNTYITKCSDVLRVISLVRYNKTAAAKTLIAQSSQCRENQRILFILAACQRSRFDIKESFPLFGAVIAIDSSTPVAACSFRIIQLDSDQVRHAEPNHAYKSFVALTKLVDENPDDVPIRWMLAVECRQWNRAKEGAQQYKRILEKWDPGPVLVHQTYANLLDELKQYDEALVERRKAVEMEPAGWSYDGMANTLTHLGRYEEANLAHVKAIELVPNQSNHWSNWAWTVECEEKYDEAIEKCEHAVKLDPKNGRALWIWATCLEGQGKKAEALAKYQELLTIYPARKDAIARVEALKSELEQ